jgi:hypothetical protein
MICVQRCGPHWHLLRRWKDAGASRGGSRDSCLSVSPSCSISGLYRLPIVSISSLSSIKGWEGRGRILKALPALRKKRQRGGAADEGIEDF